MQNYEETVRISRAPVILPPAGAPSPENEAAEPAQESPAVPELFPASPVIAMGARREKGPLDTVVLAQMILCGLLVAAALFLRSSSPAVYEDLRGWYDNHLYREITVQVEAPAA